MPRHPSTQPTEVELQILRILWEHGPSTARGIHNQLAGERETNYSTTVKMLSVMLDKGLVKRDETVRPQVYRTVVTRDRTQERMLKDLIRKVYDGSPPAFAIDPVAPRLPETVVAAPAVMPAGEVIPAPVAGNDPATPAPVDRTPVVRRWLPWATVLWLLGVCGLSLRPVIGWLLTRLEEQRAAGSVVALAATGGSLLDRARRLLGQPGAEFGYRSAAAWLAGLVAVGVVTLALATGDAPREKAGNGSADEVGQEDAAPAPVEHEAVMVVREFLKATASGDFDRAVGLSTRGEFKREGLAEVAKSFDLSKADIAEALVGAANAAVLTQRLAARGEAKPGQFGFHLVSEHDRWLIRDVDFLPDDQAAEKWLADFRELEPGARPAEAGPRSAEQQSDREAMLAYARALAAGDLRNARADLEIPGRSRPAVRRKLAGMFARAEEMRVELVSMQPLGTSRSSPAS